VRVPPHVSFASAHLDATGCIRRNSSEGWNTWNTVLKPKSPSGDPDQLGTSVTHMRPHEGVSEGLPRAPINGGKELGQSSPGNGM